VLLALLPLLGSAACGARWSDGERAAVFARGATAAGSGPVGDRSDAGAGPATAVADASPGAVDASGATGLVAGPVAAGGGTTASGTAACAVPSDAPGVTDKELTVGSISTLTGPSPGLGASSAAATRAYIAYLNSKGGVCGRKIVLKEGDDGAEGGRYRSVFTGLEPHVLGIVGGFNIGDVGALDLMEEKKVPVVGIPSDDRGTAVSTFFDMNPPFEGPDIVIGKYKHLYDQGVRTATEVYLGITQSRLEAQRQARLMEAAGIHVVDVNELPLSTLSYDGPARRVGNSKADYLLYIGDIQGNGNMARAMQSAGVEPKVEEYFVFSYGGNFIERAGPEAAEGIVSFIRALPNEEAGQNAELARYLEWMDRAAPGQETDMFASDAWASTKAFFDSVATIPGPITRAALVNQLRAVKTFDAGGMFGPIRLGQELTNGCVVEMQVRNGKWVRVAPASGFLC
jgi:ABC-type branched-subunit amino acid transport system substrate-binding protein